MNEELVFNIENIVLRLGYECVNVAFKNEFGRERIKLQVLIDSIGGINVDDCERVSKNINLFLDKNENNFRELQNASYYLEVSSPGLERPLFKLSDYERFKNREARIKINGLIENRKTFTGILYGVSDNNVLILVDDEIKQIPFDLIRSANLLFRFENDSNKTKHNKKSKKNSKTSKRKEDI